VNKSVKAMSRANQGPFFLKTSGATGSGGGGGGVPRPRSSISMSRLLGMGGVLTLDGPRTNMLMRGIVIIDNMLVPVRYLMLTVM
jgi:hypothetical protein